MSEQARAAVEDATFQPLDFQALLDARAENMRRRPKRARTRARIIASVARQLANHGYDGLTVERICEDAGMARGTFYLYFDHRSDAAVAVFRLYWSLLRKFRPRMRQRGLTQKVRQMNLFYLSSYAKNAALLANQDRLARERPDFSLDRDRLNHRWSLVIAANMRGDMEHGTKVFRARALIAMVDDLLRDIFTYGSPSMAHWADDPTLVADHLSELWILVLTGDSLPRKAQTQHESH